SVKRWEEREKAAVKVISEKDGVMRMHIPPTDPKVAEREWEEVRAKVDEIAGPALREAFRRQLTDGYSPTFLSTLGMGKLNILTAGFGTMDRFIEAKKQADGQWCYQVYDVMPDRRKGAPIDAAQFEKFAGGNGYDQQQSLSLEKNAEQLAHLPLPKEP
ncbi:MAG: hypothetical protein JWO82_663, partial [Akkermansiaceae bacterium]|nr:hypothetical protein [Akkermansiaceae bacterium]